MRHRCPFSLQEPEAAKKREQDRLLFGKGRAAIPPEEHGDFVYMCAACVDRMGEELGKSIGRCGGPFPTIWTSVTKGAGLDALRARMLREHQAAAPAEEEHTWTAEEEAEYYANAEAQYAEYEYYEEEAAAEEEEAPAPAAEDAAAAPEEDEERFPAEVEAATEAAVGEEAPAAAEEEAAIE